ncbi:MAG: hypothetical protein M3209_01955 [Acidobacteriota bacterium]|nr:hypothetical protein [Acidobacteriota bacterium]
MAHSPLAIKRRFILGDLYGRCESSGQIPVYIDTVTDEPAGFADESMGSYADAFVFHLPDDVCKKLSTGHYGLGFDYDSTGEKNKVKLNYILLVSNHREKARKEAANAKTKE